MLFYTLVSSNASPYNPVSSNTPPLKKQTCIYLSRLPSAAAPLQHPPLSCSGPKCMIAEFSGYIIPLPGSEGDHNSADTAHLLKVVVTPTAALRTGSTGHGHFKNSDQRFRLLQNKKKVMQKCPFCPTLCKNGTKWTFSTKAGQSQK